MMSNLDIHTECEPHMYLRTGCVYRLRFIAKVDLNATEPLVGASKDPLDPIFEDFKRGTMISAVIDVTSQDCALPERIEDPMHQDHAACAGRILQEFLSSS